MSKTVYLHAGAPKTGTSALQVVLAKGRHVLLERGTLYPDCPSDMKAKRGLVTSGNGQLLSHLWQSNLDASAVTRQLATLSSLLISHPTHDILYSSEFLSLSRPTTIFTLNQCLQDRGYRLKIIYYVRHLLDAAISTYAQTLRGGGTMAFTDWIKIFKHRYNTVISGFIDAIGKENVILKLYDDEKHDLVGRFISIFGNYELCDLFTNKPGRLNRALSEQEINIVLRVNAELLRNVGPKKARELAKHITEHLSRDEHDKRPMGVVTRPEFDKFLENNEAVMHDVNRFAEGLFQIKIKSDDVVINERGVELWNDKDLIFFSIIESLLQRFNVAAKHSDEINWG